jgi:hypothetical protein
LGPRGNEGSQRRCYVAVWGCDQAGRKGCHFWWRRGFYSQKKGAQDGLGLLERPINAPCRPGGGIATARCNGAAMAPLGVGS